MFMRKQAAARQADILGVLKSTKAPMTAYQILGKLQKEEPDIAPPTVYRALAALTDQGRAHKLESLKSFVPCRCEHDQSLPVLTICDDCGLVEEHDGGSLKSKLSSLISESDFTPKRHIVELHGYCRDCSS
jgi:Fur family zinc uptake transcriptional regulator